MLESIGDSDHLLAGRHYESLSKIQMKKENHQKLILDEIRLEANNNLKIASKNLEVMDNNFGLQNS